MSLRSLPEIVPHPALRALPLIALLALAPVGGTWAADGITGPRTGRWAHETSSLKPDPAVTWGRLNNGFRYALLPSDGVPGRVSLRLAILTGSLDERDSERGIAHYLEHLAFRDTRNFTTEQQVEFFQRLGMDPTSDVNARTSYDSTVYQLDVRESSPRLLDNALLWMRDVADGARFTPEEIDEERGVILSELRVRGGLSSGNMEAVQSVVFKGMRMTDRGPGGRPERIRAFQQADFLEFYRRNYRCDQMILIAAGDFDLAGFSQRIEQHFADMQRPNTPLPAREEGRLDTTKELRASIFRVTGVRGAMGCIAYATPFAMPGGGREAHLYEMRRRLAFSVFNQRVAKELGGNAEYQHLINFEIMNVNAPLDEDEWAQGLSVMDDLIRYTVQKGFTPAEIESVKRRRLARIDFQLGSFEHMDPEPLAEDLTDSILHHKVYTSYETRLRWERDWLRSVTKREIDQAFATSWDLDRLSFIVSGNVNIEGGSREVVKKIADARRAGLRSFRPEATKVSEFKLPVWGEPTPVVESKTVPELNAKLMRFGNNVRFNFAYSRSDPGVVTIMARFGTGVLELPRDRPALKDVALQTLLSGGTTHFSAAQISDLVRDHLFMMNLALDENDAFAIRAAVASDKIQIPLGIIADTLSRPVFATLTHREEKIRAAVQTMHNNGMTDGEQQLENHLFKGDPRFTTSVDPKDFLGVSAVDVRDWLHEPLARGYVELTVVGDISEEAAVEAVARTLGSLPTRAAEKTLMFKVDPVRITAPPGFRRIEFVGEQHVGLAAGVWPIQEDLDVRDVAALYILSKVFEQHVFAEIRNRLGLAYTPQVALERFSGFQNFALMRARVASDPADCARVASLLSDIAGHLAEGGITESEFLGARGIFSARIRFEAQENSFLLNALRRAQEHPTSLENSIAIKNGLIDEITLKEVDDWARKIFVPSNSRTAAIVPKPFIGVFTPGQ